MKWKAHEIRAGKSVMDQWPSHFPAGLGLPSRPGILAGPSHSADCPHASPFLTLSSALSHLLTSVPTIPLRT